MKKSVVLFISVIFLMAFTANSASAQKHKYYYYPGSNVYYDAGPGLYYYNQGAAWTGVRVLPPGISITVGAPRYVIYHQGPNVWVDNRVHVVKYKSYKNKPGKYKKYKNNGKKHPQQRHKDD